TPDIDANKVRVTAYLPAPAPQNLVLTVRTEAGKPNASATKQIQKGEQQVSFDMPIANARRWTLTDPYLYTVEAELQTAGATPKNVDKVKSYFGMRKISVTKLPGTQIPYVSLNNEPVYLQLTLDQSYHPEGFYTFPSDQFMREEILKAREIGLNGIRTHIKADIPRKLYWADRLGVLVMADLPNSWGDPDADARQESESTLREMIKRDFNHPAIFSWITFNETWGLTTKGKLENGKSTQNYLPETQKWVASVYRLAKSLDPSRLVEDNSICCGRGHTETDLNSWHEYLPGYGWDAHVSNIVKQTYPGSEFHFEKGYKQGENQPMFNSEFGNVWGYEGSTGDVDWSWDYHRAINTFRQYPQMSGWLYTEHHDVINEWNGYWKFDRTVKTLGVEEQVPGMSIRDFHAPLYISTGQNICLNAKAGQTVAVPLTASFMTGQTDLGNNLTLTAKLYGHDAFGQPKTWWTSTRNVPYKPWMQQNLDSLRVPMPKEKSVAILSLVLTDASGTELHHNMVSFVVNAPVPAQITLANNRKAQVLTIPAAKFSDAKWSQKQWNVLDGKKVNGAGSGFIEYRMPWPKGMAATGVESAVFLVEAGAKELFVKDRDKVKESEGDRMLGGGEKENSKSPNSYPMTDVYTYPSAVTVRCNGQLAGRYDLPDDPADHRGILSWQSQPEDKKLRE
ncbi:MAG TPA: glycoside hydrolase family 2 TIM barrel-domain containing protein, partial [Fibrella sp.]